MSEEVNEETLPEEEEEINPLLEAIKVRLAVTGNHHDGLLLGYAEDTKQYLLRAGVLPSVLESDRATGVICRGVSDMWTGEGKFSEMFKQMAIQLACEVVEDVQAERV